MNSDDFEQRLRRQPLRPIPPEWRAEILSALRLSERHQAPGVTHRIHPSRSFLSTLNSQLSALLWPSRKAWVALATIWVLLFAVNAATADKSNAVARTAFRPGPEMIMAWREHERMLIELIGPQEMPVVGRPKAAIPRPRSERRNEFLRA